MRAFRYVVRFMLIATAVFFGFGQAAFSGAGQGVARGIDGRTLMTFCSGKYDTDLGVCSGYIMAVAEAMMAGERVYGQRSCGHDGIKAQQLVDLVRMDVGENDSITRQGAGTMVADILARSFPCYDSLTPSAGGR